MAVFCAEKAGPTVRASALKILSSRSSKLSERSAGLVRQSALLLNASKVLRNAMRHWSNGKSLRKAHVQESANTSVVGKPKVLNDI
jgi:hypothetical protein